MNQRQKAALRTNLSLALMFLKKAEQAADVDHFDQIDKYLSQMDGALFDVRWELLQQTTLDKIISEREQAAIMDEYNADNG